MISITIANGNEFGIDESDQMFIGQVNHPETRIFLGKASVQNFRKLIGFMEKLQIHMHHDPSQRTYNP